MTFHNIWKTISRTRPIPRAQSCESKRYTVPRQERIWTSLHDSLGITLPLALCYVISLVVNETSRRHAAVSLILAGTMSVLNGFCFAELTTSSRYCSSSVMTVSYQLGGEFLAFLVGLSRFLGSILTYSLLAKCLSSTMEAIGHSHIKNISLEQLGRLPFSEEPPDLLAVGISAVTSVLLACGLQKSRALRFFMNSLSLLMVTFVGYLAGAEYFSKEIGKDLSLQKPISSSPNDIIRSTAVFTCLFQQYFVLCHRSKLRKKPKKFLAQSIPSSAGFVLLLSLIYTVLTPVDVGNRLDGSFFGLIGTRLNWASFIIGCFQIVILGIGLTEAGETGGSEAVALASEGFLPKWLAHESSTHFVHSRAHCFTGLCVIVFSGFFTIYFVLMLLSTLQIYINICLVSIRLYKPYRQTNDKNLGRAKDNPKTYNISDTWNWVKSKLLKKNINPASKSKLTSRKTERKKVGRQSSFEDDVEIPLLTGLYSSVEKSFESDSDDDKGSEEPFPLVSPSTVFNAASATPDPPQDTPDEEADIDTIVLEFKEFNVKHKSNVFLPDSISPKISRQALILIICIFICNVIFSYFLIYSFRKSLVTTAASVVFIILETVCVALINFIPKQEQTSLTSLRMPAFPWLHSIILLVNIILWISVLDSTFWLTTVILILGLLLYVSYSSKNSFCANIGKDNFHDALPIFEPQAIWLSSPLRPCLVELQTFPQPPRNPRV